MVVQAASLAAAAWAPAAALAASAGSGVSDLHLSGAKIFRLSYSTPGSQPPDGTDSGGGAIDLGGGVSLSHYLQLYLNGTAFGGMKLSLAYDDTLPLKDQLQLDLDGGWITVSFRNFQGTFGGETGFTCFNRGLRGLDLEVRRASYDGKLYLADTTTSQKTETLKGNDTRGPYYLSQADILEYSETVTVGGSPMTRGTDYFVDYLQGVLWFFSPVRWGAAIVVSYEVFSPVPRKFAALQAHRELGSGSSLSVAYVGEGKAGGIESLGDDAAGYRILELGGTYGLGPYGALRAQAAASQMGVAEMPADGSAASESARAQILEGHAAGVTADLSWAGWRATLYHRQVGRDFAYPGASQTPLDLRSYGGDLSHSTGYQGSGLRLEYAVPGHVAAVGLEDLRNSVMPQRLMARSVSLAIGNETRSISLNLQHEDRSGAPAQQSADAGDRGPALPAAAQGFGLDRTRQQMDVSGRLRAGRLDFALKASREDAVDREDPTGNCRLQGVQLDVTLDGRITGSVLSQSRVQQSAGVPMQVRLYDASLAFAAGQAGISKAYFQTIRSEAAATQTLGALMQRQIGGTLSMALSGSIDRTLKAGSGDLDAEARNLSLTLTGKPLFGAEQADLSLSASYRERRQYAAEGTPACASDMVAAAALKLPVTSTVALDLSYRFSEGMEDRNSYTGTVLPGLSAPDALVQGADQENVPQIAKRIRLDLTVPLGLFVQYEESNGGSLQGTGAGDTGYAGATTEAGAEGSSSDSARRLTTVGATLVPLGPTARLSGSLYGGWRDTAKVWGGNAQVSVSVDPRVGVTIASGAERRWGPSVSSPWAAGFSLETTLRF